MRRSPEGWADMGEPEMQEGPQGPSLGSPLGHRGLLLWDPELKSQKGPWGPRDLEVEPFSSGSLSVGPGPCCADGREHGPRVWSPDLGPPPASPSAPGSPCAAPDPPWLPGPCPQGHWLRCCHSGHKQCQQARAACRRRRVRARSRARRFSRASVMGPAWPQHRPSSSASSRHSDSRSSSSSREWAWGQGRQGAGGQSGPVSLSLQAPPPGALGAPSSLWG